MNAREAIITFFNSDLFLCPELTLTSHSREKAIWEVYLDKLGSYVNAVFCVRKEGRRVLQ